MKQFKRTRDGEVTSNLNKEEIQIFESLCSQLVEFIDSEDQADSAKQRLFPIAYPEDEAAATEFRELTIKSLVASKTSNARIVQESLSAMPQNGKLVLNPRQSRAWLLCLNDLRLILADRLGIEKDDQAPSKNIEIQDLYDWLGYLQNSLVEALDFAPMSTNDHGL
ncbi:MAG: DUF2017 family protein [Cryobacterium sp.]|nr:DUF2017 family protein [Cryobacterium sp.]